MFIDYHPEKVFKGGFGLFMRVPLSFCRRGYDVVLYADERSIVAPAEEGHLVKAARAMVAVWDYTALVVFHPDERVFVKLEAVEELEHLPSPTIELW
jgi:hypothetical protein